MPLLRSAFIALSRNKMLRNFSERSTVGRRMSSRFVAGMEIDEALRVAEAVNRQGMAVTLDSLGESVTSETAAEHRGRSYHRLLDSIAERKLNANISVKLTQMGLQLSPLLAETIAWKLAEHARPAWQLCPHRHGRLAADAGDAGHCAAAACAEELRGAIGIVIQAYLYRSESDIEQLLADGIRVRLCKGAYKEPAEVAFPRKADVDANYPAERTCCSRAASITGWPRTMKR